MRTYLIAMFLCAGLLMPLALQGQEKKGSASRTGGDVTVTGCLQKGDGPNEYAITENGKSYGLRSDTVNLASHLNHKVTVTGTPTSATEKKGSKESTEESEHLQVTNLKMVSTSCQ